MIAARHRGRARARTHIDCLLWLQVAVALAWTVVTYRVAALELPAANVMATGVAMGAAWAAGHRVGRRR